MDIFKRKSVIGFCFIFTAVCLWCLVGSGSALAAEYKTNVSNGQNYTVINRITVSNPTNRAIDNVSVTLPLMSKDELGDWQTLVKEELNPIPEKIISNSDGGRDATYNIGRISARSNVVIEQRFQIINHALTYQLNFRDYQYDQADVDNIDSRYLQEEPGIEVNDPAIIYYARSKTQGQTNPYLMAKSLYSDINLYMTYDNSVTGHSAVKALQTGRGNCVDYSFLYIACLRSLGIPARIHTGYIYSPETHSTPEYINADGTIKMNSLKHNWVEFYVSGMGWIVADPTYTYYVGDEEDMTKSVDWSRFAEITTKNRLIILYKGLDSASVTYSGSTAPTVSYDTRLSLAEDVSQFYDLAGHWAREDVMALCNWTVPVVYGKSEHNFGVNDSITRAELVAMINRVLDHRDGSSVSPVDIEFSDVAASHWAYADIKKAVARGYVVGFPDGTFQPNKSVTRAEMMSIINNVANLPNRSGSPFTDLDESGYKWAKGAIENCYNAELAKGITTTAFEPSKFLTRGEAAVFINRWIKSSYY